MAKISGIVEAVRDFKTNTGATMYTLVVNGERYGTGSKKPNCSAGDMVTFDVVEKGQYKNADLRSLVVEAGARGAVAAQSAAASKPFISNDNRQEVISKQAAVNSAIGFCNLVVAAGALPGSTAKATAEDKYDVIEALFDKKLREFYAFSTGNALPEEGPAPGEPGAPGGEW